MIIYLESYIYVFLNLFVQIEEVVFFLILKQNLDPHFWNLEIDYFRKNMDSQEFLFLNFKFLELWCYIYNHSYIILICSYLIQRRFHE